MKVGKYLKSCTNLFLPSEKINGRREKDLKKTQKNREDRVEINKGNEAEGADLIEGKWEQI